MKNQDSDRAPLGTYFVIFTHRPAYLMTSVKLQNLIQEIICTYAYTSKIIVHKCLRFQDHRTKKNTYLNITKLVLLTQILFILMVPAIQKKNEFPHHQQPVKNLIIARNRHQYDYLKTQL